MLDWLDFAYCRSLIERRVWCHDENRYESTLTCSALSDAADRLRTANFAVVLHCMDTATRTPLRCFATIDEALDFMNAYHGCGDYLYCYFGETLVAHYDLMFEHSAHLTVSRLWWNDNPEPGDIPF